MAVIVDQKRLGGGSARRWERSLTLRRCCACSFHGLANRMWAPPMSFLSMTLKVCARSATDWGERLESILRLYDLSQSLNKGAILFPEYAVNSWGWSIYAQSGLFDIGQQTR